MAKHSIQVVDDGTLETGDGWAIVRCEVSNDLYFVVERSAATDADRLNDAWHAAQQLVIEQAVRDGIVEYRDPEARPELA